MRKCKIPQGRIMLSSYERAAEKLLKGMPKTKPIGLFYEGRFLTGAASTYKTKQGRQWNTFWRIKQIGKPIIA